MTTETALITGASSGIGKELALLFAARGYNLILVGRLREPLEELAKTLSNCNINVFIIIQDLKNKDAGLAIKSYLDAHNIQVDALVNSAGFSTFGTFFDTSLDSQMDLLAVNIRALTALTHLLLPAMLQKGKGKILNIASLAAFMPIPQMSVYCATKSYIVTFSKALAEELRDSGVSVTVVCPGVTKTAFLQRANIGDHNVRLYLLPSMSAQKVAKIAFKGFLSSKILVIPGFKNKIFPLFGSWIIKLFGVRITRGWLKRYK
jgi:short-subunit dehydrogenase